MRKRVNKVSIFVFSKSSAANLLYVGKGLNDFVFQFSATSLPRREQINSITSFIDASNVYGSSEEEQLLLRKNGTG